MTAVFLVTLCLKWHNAVHHPHIKQDNLSRFFHPSLLLAQNDTRLFPPPTAYYRLAFNGRYCNWSTPTVLLLRQLFPHFVLESLISPSNYSTLRSPLLHFLLFQAIFPEYYRHFKFWYSPGKCLHVFSSQWQPQIFIWVIYFTTPVIKWRYGKIQALQ